MGATGSMRRVSVLLVAVCLIGLATATGHQQQDTLLPVVGAVYPAAAVATTPIVAAAPAVVATPTDGIPPPVAAMAVPTPIGVVSPAAVAAAGAVAAAVGADGVAVPVINTVGLAVLPSPQFGGLAAESRTLLSQQPEPDLPEENVAKVLQALGVADTDCPMRCPKQIRYQRYLHTVVNYAFYRPGKLALQSTPPCLSFLVTYIDAALDGFFTNRAVNKSPRTEKLLFSNCLRKCVQTPMWQKAVYASKSHPGSALHCGAVPQADVERIIATRTSGTMEDTDSNNSTSSTDPGNGSRLDPLEVIPRCFPTPRKEDVGFCGVAKRTNSVQYARFEELVMSQSSHPIMDTKFREANSPEEAQPGTPAPPLNASQCEQIELPADSFRFVSLGERRACAMLKESQRAEATAETVARAGAKGVTLLKYSDQEAWWWPTNVIPYFLAPGKLYPSGNDVNDIALAIRHWQQNSCFQFVQVDDSWWDSFKTELKHGFIWIYKAQQASDFCFAYQHIGDKTSYKAVEIRHRGCGNLVIHELSHVMAVTHAFNAVDRDDYVHVYVNNATRSKEFDNEASRRVMLNDPGFPPMDFKSAMFYPGKDEDNTLYLTPKFLSTPSDGVKEADLRRAQRVTYEFVMGSERLSDYDMAMLNKLYCTASRKAKSDDLFKRIMKKKKKGYDMAGQKREYFGHLLRNGQQMQKAGISLQELLAQAGVSSWDPFAGAGGGARFTIRVHVGGVESNIGCSGQHTFVKLIAGGKSAPFWLGSVKDKETYWTKASTNYQYNSMFSFGPYVIPGSQLDFAITFEVWEGENNGLKGVAFKDEKLCASGTYTFKSLTREPLDKEGGYRANYPVQVDRVTITNKGGATSTVVFKWSGEITKPIPAEKARIERQKRYEKGLIRELTRHAVMYKLGSKNVCFRQVKGDVYVAASGKDAILSPNPTVTITGNSKKEIAAGLKKLSLKARAACFSQPGCLSVRMDWGQHPQPSANGYVLVAYLSSVSHVSRYNGEWYTLIKEPCAECKKTKVDGSAATCLSAK